MRHMDIIFKDASYSLNSDSSIFQLVRKVQEYFKELYELYENPHSYEEKLMIQEILDVLSTRPPSSHLK
jgi:hypothetical protein